MTSELQRLRALALATGWRIRPGTKHEQWLSPDGKTIATVPNNGPGGKCRHLKNTRALLRQGGLAC